MRTHQVTSTTSSHYLRPILYSSPPLLLPPPMKFRRGDMVEVASDQQGFIGSYYEATVVADLVGYEYVIEYHNLLKDDMSGPLKEVVAAAQVRPKPPPILRGGFRLNDVVDTFDNDGWWVGRITGRVDEEKYVVFFDTTGDEIAYPKDRIRVHQNWIQGNWFPGGNIVGI